jgi:hypothetical protein
VERELLPALRLLAPDLARLTSPDECFERLAAEVSRVCGLVATDHLLPPGSPRADERRLHHCYPGSPRKAELPSAQLVAGSDSGASNPSEAGELHARLDAAGPR